MAETSPNDASPASTVESGPPCRLCGVPLTTTFVDLGASPLCERFLTAAELDEMEPFYPLHVRICRNCLLVQLPEYVSPDEIFREYAYFSSFSDSWVEHARQFADTMIERLGLGPTAGSSRWPATTATCSATSSPAGSPSWASTRPRNVAEAARAQGVPTLAEFFGVALAESLLASDGPADLIVANNVYAHVPDLHDVTGGFKVLLAPGGTISIEFPHLVRLVEGNQFDTIYHEHFSYFTLHTSSAALAAHGLRVFDVEELSSHGGSLRLFAAHEDDPRPTSERVVELLAREEALGYTTVEGHPPFAERVASTKRALLAFLVAEREAGRTIAAYGAPGKANTLLNYCGIGPDLISFTVDRNPYKHGRFTPGMRIPIRPPEALDAERPDVVVILPWNLRREIAAQLAPLRAAGTRLVVPIPSVEVVE